VFPILPADADELAEVQRISDRIAEHALDLGGTTSGEHGIGLGKRHLLEREHGPGVAVMRTIKQALDPLQILNPGKVL
jgi:D-lactate dehydrogenase (cytochrome)